jgi:hypothetical protein
MEYNSIPCPCKSGMPFLLCCGRNVSDLEAQILFFKTMNENASNYDWSSHREVVLKMLKKAFSTHQSINNVLILGAGNCNDMPLDYISERVNQIVLVDIDQNSLNKARRQLPNNAQKKIVLKVQDLNGPYVANILNTITSLARHDEYGKLLIYLKNICSTLNDIDGHPNLEEHHYDLVVSVCVTSQLFAPYAQAIVESCPESQYDRISALIAEISNFLADQYFTLLANTTAKGGVLLFASDIFEWNWENGPNPFAKIVPDLHILTVNKITELAKNYGHLKVTGCGPKNVFDFFNLLYCLDWIWTFSELKKYVVRGLLLTRNSC